MDDHFSKILSQPTQNTSGASKNFIPSKSYTGSKVGYVFQMGKYGLGYYFDFHFSFGAPSKADSSLSTSHDDKDEEVEYKYVRISLYRIMVLLVICYVSAADCSSKHKKKI